jgi:ubiquitin-activating enzyme E1
VATNLSWKQQQVINAWTHKNGVAFIAAETRGLFGCDSSSVLLHDLLYATPNRCVFNDFGPEFTCIDPTGEEALSGMIVSVSKVRSSTQIFTCM